MKLVAFGDPFCKQQKKKKNAVYQRVLNLGPFTCSGF